MMNIALIAHDKKKELMADFCIAYKSILGNHTLHATGSTGTVVSEATGLPINKFFPGPLGGAQQIGARIVCNEVDLVIFFRDPLNAQEFEPDVNSIIRICDTHNIPIATNVATAEMLIKGVERGDLEWRELVKKTNLI